MPVVDLRLVPAAAACWVAATVLVAAPGSVVTGVAVAAALVLLVVLGVPHGLGAVRGQVLLVACTLLVLAATVTVQGAARSGGLVGEMLTSGDVGCLRGVVASEVVPLRSGAQGDRYRVTVRVTSVATTVDAGDVRGPARATVLVLGGPELLDLAYGATVDLPATLGATDAGDTRAALAFVEDDPSSLTACRVRVVEPPGPLGRAVNAIRADFLDVTADLSPQARGLVPGVAIGDTSRLPPDLDEAMLATSLTHVTAVSGSHFAILAAAVLGLCTVLSAPRWVRVAVAGVVMAGFVLLVHPEPSVLRAAVMCAVALFAILLGRPSQSMAALCVTVLVLLLVDPWMSRSFGFVLSVLATAGLVVGTAPVTRWLERFVPRWAALAVAVPLAAQLACAPVVVLLDPSVSLYAVPANLLAAPALVPATVLGVLGALLAPWAPAVSLLLATGAGWATAWIALVAEVFADVPGARLPWLPGPAGAWLLAGVTAAGVALVAVRPVEVLSSRLSRARRSRADRSRGAPSWRSDDGTRDVERAARHAGARAALRPVLPAVRCVALLLVAVLVLAVVRPAWLGDLVRRTGGLEVPWAEDWVVASCDVGQGDATLVRTSPGHALLIDVGPQDGGVGDCLDALGVEHLDLLVLTHFHADHVGGLQEALQGRTVTGALVSPVAEPADQERATMRTLVDAGIPVRVAGPDLQGTLPGGGGPDGGDVRWSVLWPATGAGLGANDGSVALDVRAQGLRLVGLGDLETSGQAGVRAVLEAGPDEPVDVVKVAHHGSATQDRALAGLLAPRVALVSSGAGNTYGHPTVDALDLYRSVGAAVVRTDLCGTVGLVVRGDDVLVAGSCL
ncbi:ComEC/Rec2 family competence protein [Sanguibacter suaedae]|uniref:ComEC/Rec2 family competence protein n=1 Tax=Sanguibacter suaedae TaxID=2795737 RepID=A0A934ICI7_9MICO|nr:ComEC/Rec2 family competence protein [Sanguibacter suaedae]MBI9114384.1 ComEC/Rec2 family competence protein [Sanguibacter suaedae]